MLLRDSSKKGKNYLKGLVQITYYLQTGGFAILLPEMVLAMLGVALIPAVILAVVGGTLMIIGVLAGKQI